MIKALIFDWHGVLDRVKFTDFINIISQMKHLPLSQIETQLWQDGQNYAANKLTPPEFWSKVQVSYQLTHRQLDRVKKYLLAIKLNQPLWNILAELKKKYQLAILSDCPLDKVRLIRQTVNLSLFSQTFFSAETAFLKQNPEFFTLATNGLNLKPQSCLFIDDSPKNIILARQSGLTGLVYRHSRTLKKLTKLI